VKSRGCPLDVSSCERCFLHDAVHGCAVDAARDVLRNLAEEPPSTILEFDDLWFRIDWQISSSRDRVFAHISLYASNDWALKGASQLLVGSWEITRIEDGAILELIEEISWGEMSSLRRKVTQLLDDLDSVVQRYRDLARCAGCHGRIGHMRDAFPDAERLFCLACVREALATAFPRA
jgi:hypothetical protein